MAHYKIFQITEQELSREEYITEDSFEYHNICDLRMVYATWTRTRKNRH